MKDRGSRYPHREDRDEHCHQHEEITGEAWHFCNDLSCSNDLS